MAKLRYLVCAGSLLAMMMAGSAKGAIEAVSFLNIDAFGLFVDTGGGVPGAPITSGVQVTVISALFTSAAQANIFSIPGGPVATVAGGLTPAGLDTAIAQEGSAVGDNSLFPPPFGAGPAPYGTNLAAPVPHALGDTAGSGSIIAGLGFPFGADSRKTAQADLAVAGAPIGFDIGTADASDSSLGSFLISVVGGPLSIVGIFDASRFLLADLTPSPPGSASAASTSFSITVSAGGAPIFVWAPNGLPGGIVGGVEYSDPFTLNSSVTAAPGGTTTDIDTSLGGFGGPGPPPFSAGVTLLPGIYSFDITETVSADVSSVGQIPEPATVFVWAVLALCGGATARYFSVRKA